MKICPVGVQLIHADRWRERYDEAVTFHSFANTLNYAFLKHDVFMCCIQF